MSLYAHPSHVSYVPPQLSAFLFMYGQGARRFGMKVQFNFSFSLLIFSSASLFPILWFGLWVKGWKGKECIDLDWNGEHGI